MDVLSPVYNYAVKQLINRLFARGNLRIVNQTAYAKLVENESKFRSYELYEAVGTGNYYEFIEACRKSRSQLLQDVFVLSQTSFKRGGFFVEFGATDGIELSNTYLLEKHFGWNGILAEPAKCWHQSLQQNRVAALDTSCVWSKSGDLIEFREVEDGKNADPSLSTIRQFSKSDRHKKARRHAEHYSVQTISLDDLLIRHQAPRMIDYLSIDTEGSEFEILSAFNFASFEIATISCEHNYTANRERIHDLLREYGYRRVLTDFSKFDDWYILE